jgi:hypothetical protein
MCLYEGSYNDIVGGRLKLRTAKFVNLEVGIFRDEDKDVASTGGPRHSSGKPLEQRGLIGQCPPIRFLSVALGTGCFIIQAELCLLNTPQYTFAEGVRELGPIFRVVPG